MMRNLLWCLLIIVLGLNADVFAQPELDTTFNSTGKVVLSDTLASADDLAVLPNNKIVMVSGCTTTNGSFPFCTVRLNENGSPDTTFGPGFPTSSSGYVLTNIPGSTDPRTVTGVSIQADGKIVLVGYATFTISGIGNRSKLVVVRYNPDGSLDASFGTGGIVIADITPGDNVRAKEVAIQPDGKIVIVGYSAHEASQIFTYTQFVARYNANGSLDNIFGTGGIVRTTISGLDTFGNSVAIQPDGKILAGGEALTVSGSPNTSASYLLVRLNTNGSLDATWDNDGVVRIVYGTSGLPETDGFLSLAVQPDGRVLALGSRNIVYRFHKNGLLDLSFDFDGFRPAFPVSLNEEAPYDLLLSPRGRITVVGHSRPGPSFAHQYSVARYRQDGSSDPAFSEDGYLDIDVGNGPDSAKSVAADSRGRIVVAGTTGMGQMPNPLVPGVFSVARLVAPAASIALSGIIDFDGDGLTDLSVFRPSEGNWYITNSSNNAFRAVHFGAIGDVIVPGDYDGDGKTDVAVFRPSNGYWYILNSSDSSVRSIQLGQSGDIPVTGDFDGDGKSDIVVFRPSAGTFYLLHSSDSSFHFKQWGANGDVPVMGDYDGDARTDFVVYRPSTGTFYILSSFDGTVRGQQFGQSGDKPVAGYFDADGKTDIGVYRPSSGVWYFLNSSDNSFRGTAWGAVGDLAAPGDYDGDGLWDVTVFRPSNGTFYILLSETNELRAEEFGASGDVPVAGAFVR